MKKSLLFLSLAMACATQLMISQEQEIDEQKKKEEVQPLETPAKARQLLTDVLKLHALFNTKMIAPEFGDFISGKINRWRRDKNLRIPENTSWNIVKFDLDQLGSQLALIQSDLHFIDELRKNHEVYKAIQQLKQNLQRIYNLPTRLKSISFIPLLNAYAQQLYGNKLLEKTNAVLKVAITEEPKVEPEKRLDYPFEFYPSLEDIPAPVEDFSGYALTDYSRDFDTTLSDDFDFDFDFDF